jgi:hypothetical protein
MQTFPGLTLTLVLEWWCITYPYEAPVNDLGGGS